jgi:hypothetical protein
VVSKGGDVAASKKKETTKKRENEIGASADLRSSVAA